MTQTRTADRLGLLSLLFLGAALFLFLFGFAADAQTVLGNPLPAESFGQKVLAYVLPALVPIIGSLVIAVLTKLATFLHAKEGNSKVAGAFAIATDYIETAFVHIRAGIEADLKLALADGTLDAAERAQLVAKLVALAKAELPAGVQAILGGALGPALETWLAGRAGQVVQAAVSEGKLGPSLAKIASVPS